MQTFDNLDVDGKLIIKWYNRCIEPQCGWVSKELEQKLELDECPVCSADWGDANSVDGTGLMDLLQLLYLGVHLQIDKTQITMESCNETRNSYSKRRRRTYRRCEFTFTNSRKSDSPTD